MSNPLTDVIPAQARKYVYALVALGALTFAAWQASDGDWLQFIGGLLVSLANATAASNTGTPFRRRRDERGAVDIGAAMLVIFFGVLILQILGVIGHHC